MEKHLPHACWPQEPPVSVPLLLSSSEPLLQLPLPAVLAVRRTPPSSWTGWRRPLTRSRRACCDRWGRPPAGTGHWGSFPGEPGGLGEAVVSLSGCRFATCWLPVDHKCCCFLVPSGLQLHNKVRQQIFHGDEYQEGPRLMLTDRTSGNGSSSGSEAANAAAEQPAPTSAAAQRSSKAAAPAEPSSSNGSKGGQGPFKNMLTMSSTDSP